MPTETVIVLGGVTIAFIIFAAALAWADRQTRGFPPKPAE